MEKLDRKSHQINAEGQALGRLASQIALILRGKNKPTFDPAKDEGDYVEVANCSKIKFTGKKMEQKEYKWHTNYPGGLRTKKMKDVFKGNPGQVLKEAVWGMLPKNKLRDQMIKRLRTLK